MIPLRYRWRPGAVAWLVHRCSGVALALYIFVHLYVLSGVLDRGRFEAMVGLLESPLAKAGELGLLAVLLAHSLNGVRVTFLELGAPARLHKPMLIACGGVFLVLLLSGAIVVLGLGGGW